MNDIILSGLLNLFALSGADNGLDKKKSLDLVSSYMSKFYGIRNVQSYINLYSDLRDYYDDFPDMDRNAIVDGICANLNSKVRADEKITMLLRLMEFCSSKDDFSASETSLFLKAAEGLSIGSDTYAGMVNFIRGTESPDVLVFPTGGGDGIIKTLFFKDYNLLVFSYSGTSRVYMNDIQVMDGVFQVWQQSSMLKSSSFSPLYFSTIMSKYGLDESADKVELCGRDVNFRFSEGGDNGMHNLSFTLRSGELVAIMGGSGVGKSTLLSLLNGNIKPQSGSITINGHGIDEPDAKALIGFVPQDDLLIEELTVYQNLWYTAKLCFDRMSEEELDKKVISVLAQLGLEAARDLKVGSPINKYISGGQRKRLNIALELIREPAILFLDEPTSGLSSADTENVINILKELTCKGKLIVANIHQPSSDVYKLFDRLWLLDKGGYPVYDGNPIEAVSYFKSAANYADANTSACPVCGNVNPEIVLNIIDEKALDNAGNLSDKRKTSPQQWHEMYLKSHSGMPDAEVSDVPKTNQKHPGRLKQIRIFLRRNISTKVTNLQYMIVTLLEAPVLAAICGLLTHYTPDSGIYTLMENKNFPSYLFMAIIVAIFLGMSGSAEEIIKDRALLKREKFLNLSYGSYIWSKVIYMAVVCLLQTLLFIIVGNLINGVQGMFWPWWTVLFVSAFLSALIGLLLSQVMDSVVAIYITIPLLLIPQILLCGLVVKFEDLNSKSETGNVPVIGNIIPSRWSYEALAVASFSMTDYEKDLFELDRERFEALYYRESFIYELECQAETMLDEYMQGKEINPAHIGMIRKELPQLASICGMEPYSGDESYDSITNYLEDAKKILSDRSNKATLALDRKINAYIKENGKEKMLELKKANYNLQLENLTINRNTEHIYTVVNGRIVPRSGYIYLTPRTGSGNAPFYCGVKRIGDREIPTFTFNIIVLLLMCIVVGACLFADFPGKYVRHERN